MLLFGCSHVELRFINSNSDMQGGTDFGSSLPDDVVSVLNSLFGDALLQATQQQLVRLRGTCCMQILCTWHVTGQKS